MKTASDWFLDVVGFLIEDGRRFKDDGVGVEFVLALDDYEVRLGDVQLHFERSRWFLGGRRRKRSGGLRTRSRFRYDTLGGREERNKMNRQVMLNALR